MQRSHLQHAMRGLGNLPHVGEHPGIPFAIVMFGAGCAIGTGRDGFFGALLGFLFTAIWILPILLIGAADRSRLSDRLERKCAPLAQPD